MDITQVLIIVAAVAVAALLAVIALRLSARRRVKRMSHEERDLHYAQRAHKRRTSELKHDYKDVEKEAGRAVKDAESRLEDALAMGTDRIDAVKGPQGTVSLTSRELTTPSGSRPIASGLTAEATVEGSAPTADGEDTRSVVLTLHGADGETETVAFPLDKEADVRAIAARITSAAEHVDEVSRQRSAAVEEAEKGVADANAQATVQLNEAQVRYDKGLAESEAKVRDAEATARDARVR